MANARQYKVREEQQNRVTAKNVGARLESAPRDSVGGVRRPPALTCNPARLPAVIPQRYAADDADLPDAA